MTEKGQREIKLLTLKMEEGDCEPRNAGHFWKQESPQSLQKETQPCQLLDFRTLRPCHMSNLQNCHIIHLCCCKPLCFRSFVTTAKVNEHYQSFSKLKNVLWKTSLRQWKNKLQTVRTYLEYTYLIKDLVLKYIYTVYMSFIYLYLCLCPRLQFNNMTNSIIENEQKISTVY